MVEPEREVPGINARIWKTPIRRAVDPGEGFQRFDTWTAFFVIIFDNDEQHAVQDQGDSNGLIVIEQFIQQIVKWKTNDGSRKSSYDDLEPENPGIFFDPSVFWGANGHSFGKYRTTTARIAPS